MQIEQINEDRSSGLSYIAQRDFSTIERVKEMIRPIVLKYNLSEDDVIELLQKDVFIPIEIFSSRLTILESIVKYQKENRDLKFSQISILIGRDERNIWNICNNARKKYPETFEISKSELQIPVSILDHPTLSSQETIVLYLKDKLALSYHEIAILLKRDDRTIWTVHSRAKKKLGNEV